MVFLKSATAKVFGLGLAVLTPLPIASSAPASAQAPQPTQALPSSGSEVTRVEAFRASEGRVVIHYGSGITTAEAAAYGLNQEGIPAIALAGGRPGEATVIINRRVITGTYSNFDIAGGALNHFVERYYREGLASRPPAATVSPNLS